jgi:ribonuclease P protein component
MHVLLAEETVGEGAPARVGFIVSKAVGGSVVRHRVARRLRHLMRDRLADVPAGARIVVRALPAAATADSAALGRDLDRTLAAALPQSGATAQPVAGPRPGGEPSPASRP